MAAYQQLSDAPAGLYVEVERDATGASSSLTQLLGTVRAVAAQAAQQLAQLPEESKPTDVTLTFGVRALGADEYVIVLDPSVASLRVTLGWRQDTGSVAGDLVPGLPSA